MIVQAAEELKQSQQHMLKQQRQQPEPEPMRKLQPQQELQQKTRLTTNRRCRFCAVVHSTRLPAVRRSWR